MVLLIFMNNVNSIDSESENFLANITTMFFHKIIMNIIEMFLQSINKQKLQMAIGFFFFFFYLSNLYIQFQIVQRSLIGFYLAMRGPLYFHTPRLENINCNC